jgi:hypothetical protein
MLTDARVRNAKPTQRPIKLSDGGGLYLLIQPRGNKLWRMAYRFAGKQKTLAFGVYPTVSLQDAREKREAAKRVLAKGIDPSAQRRLEDKPRGRPAAHSRMSPRTYWRRLKGKAAHLNRPSRPGSMWALCWI